MEMAIQISEEQVQKSKSAKLILLFAMVSMTMMFAGLASAFVVSKSRADWLSNFQIPTAFYFSTAVIIGCSVTFYLAKKAIEKGNRSATSAFLLGTFGLGILFVFLQFRGFGQIIESGYYMTGQGSSITTTFLYVIALMHLLHLAGGLISLLIIIYNHFKQKYNPTQTLGIELGAMYWHFLDLLWVLLFLFLYFFK